MEKKSSTEMSRFINFFYFILIIFFITTMTLSLFGEKWGYSITLSKALLTTSIISFMLMVIDNNRGGVSFMLEFFSLFFVSLPAYIQISHNIFPWFAKLSVTHINSAIFYIALSHLVYICTFLFINRKIKFKHVTTTDNPKINDYRKNNRYLINVSKILIIVSIGFIAVIGPALLMTPRFDMNVDNIGNFKQQFTFMARSVSLLTVLTLAFVVVNSRSSWDKRAAITYLLLFSVPFFIINYPLALPRFILFGIILSLSSVYLDFFKTKVKLITALLSSTTLFIFFPLIKSLGRGELDLEGASERFSYEIITKYLLRVDFDAFMQIASTLEYLDKGGEFRYANNFLGVLLFMIPRSIWPSKPIDSGEIVSLFLRYPYNNVSSPLIAESIIGLGYLGPVLIFSLLARFVTRIEQHTKINKVLNNKPIEFLLYALSMGFVVIVLRGALNGVAPQFATAFLLCMLIAVFLNKKVKLKTS